MKALQPKFPWFFLLLAYGLSWLFWIPVAMTQQDYQESPLLLALMFIGVFGPGVAGILLTYREQGREGGRDFWHRVFDCCRISLRWYALILLIFPTLHLIAIAINHWLGGRPPQFTFIKTAIAIPLGIPIIFVLYLLQAGLEELGWRGYMLDRLQQLWNPLAASLVLGMFHTFWHLPTFWIVGTNQNRWGFSPDFLVFITLVLASTIFATWCYNENQRSILAVILLHTTSNLALDVFLISGSGENLWKAFFVFCAVIVALTWLMPSWKHKQAASA